MKKMLVILALMVASACSTSIAERALTSTAPPPRADAIPDDVIKQNPQDDPYPPILHSNEWQAPIPMPGPVNSAGGEDSPFISADGSLFFFFFTPDVRIPAERQLVDGVTGIYAARRTSDGWSEPQRVVLQDPGELALDGCGFYQDQQLWFCTIRKGMFREIDIWRAEFKDGRAINWRSAGEELNLGVGLGEFHFSTDWETVYFHSDRSDGLGGIDLWVSHLEDGEWQEPENLAELNTTEHDGWPYLSPDGDQLFFTRTYQGTPGIYRSHRQGDRWSVPELIISQFAGEPTLDAEGNLYFVHHYYRDGTMLEADIYVAYRR